MNPLVSSGFSHCQDTPQTCSKLYIVINEILINMDKIILIIYYAISSSPTWT